MIDKKKLANLKRYISKAPAFLFADEESYLKRYIQSEWSDYALWLSAHRFFTFHILKGMYRTVKKMKRRPRISVIMPVYNPDPGEFRQAVDSLLWQAYPNWELCVVDDLSDNRDYLRTLGRLGDRRIKVYRQDTHKGIAGASQHALEKATGDYVALIDQDDELYPDALFAFADTLQREEIDFFYSDRDMISRRGHRFMHFFRPGWSPEYLLSFNYVPHLEIYSRKLLLDIGGFRTGYEGSQDYDLVLRATEKTEKICHYPMVLYSWRQSPQSVARDHEIKSYAYEAGVKAVMEATKRRNLPVREVVENRSLWRGHYRVVWDESVLSRQKVTFVLIGSTREETNRLEQLCKAIIEPLANAEFVATDYDSGNINDRLRQIGHEGEVFFCDGAVTEVLSKGFTDMRGYLSIDGVAAAGCKFIDQDDKIHNAGLSVTDSGNILFAYRGSPVTEHGYGAVAAVPRNVSLVFPSFWGCRISELRERGYLDPKKGYFSAAIHFFKGVLQSGRRIVCVPYMCVRVTTGGSDHSADLETFVKDWMSGALRDRYYNPNLTDLFEDFGLKL